MYISWRCRQAAMAARRQIRFWFVLEPYRVVPYIRKSATGGEAPRFAEVRVHVLEGVGVCCKFRCKCSKTGKEGTGAARGNPPAQASGSRASRQGSLLGPMQPTREFHVIPT